MDILPIVNATVETKQSMKSFCICVWCCILKSRIITLLGREDGHEVGGGQG